MKVIDGKKIGEKIKDEVAAEVFDLTQKGQRRPNLSIILVGSRGDSQLYVSLKEKSAKEVGVDTNLYLIDEQDSQKNLIQVIEFLNQDDSVDGILIQLPLPKNFNTSEVLEKINPIKDVDGFCKNRPAGLISPVLLAIKESLESVDEKFKKRSAFLFYNSEIFKKEVEEFLKKQKITTDAICFAEFETIKNKQEEVKAVKDRIRSSDILISAVGCPHFIDREFLRDDMILIDVGISTKNKKVFGDIDLASAKKLNISATPVPGGIGPMTVACVLRNTLIAYKLKNKR